ncbi:MAG: hypothetical protein BWY11_00531 [Firmicutes bacterium ADurb.Bin182]|nr:MAG: hypothetical protein BWY11_00531 [Firmicutes bacterium ADurb.Bin182]
MTEILIYRENGYIVGFAAKGHTGYAREGCDVVCSAVSALTQSAVLGITELLKLTCAVSVGEGNISCMLEKDISGEDLQNAQLILGTMHLGLKSIADDYKKYLRITEKEV